MSIKASGPKLDPDTVARQKAAEQRAEAGRIEATQENLSEDTRAVLRTLGRISAAAGGIGGAGVAPNRPSQFIPGISSPFVSPNVPSGRFRR